MKKISLAVLFFSISFCLFAQTEDALYGIIQELTGTVEIKTSGSEGFTAASIGDRLDSNTIVSTSYRSFAIIEIGNTTITVRPLSRLTLQELQLANNTEIMNVNLQSGRVRVDVKPPSGSSASFTVQSPTSVASVRGTSFEFDTRNLYVSNGAVNFAGNRGQTVTVMPGESNSITVDGSASSPVEEKIAPLMPPNIAGIDILEITGSPARSGVTVTINLRFIGP